MVHINLLLVLKWLAGFTLSGVEFDANGHVPGCHPGTRIAILEALRHWADAQRDRQILWLHGPAGVGKSAIIQSLAEQLSEASKLGAALFFSRPNGRNNPALVIPTLAYQLAVRIPQYKEYLKQIMFGDPKLLEKDMERQFDALVVVPFTTLGLIAETGKWAILLDGLDECDGEDAQILIVKLISRFSLRYPTAPLTWVVSSRPEAHLQLLFASDQVNNSFKELNVPPNSEDACRDVEKFLRANFEEIHRKFRDLMPIGVPWPAEQDIARISKTSSGLFALAVTVVRYIEDSHICDPISQLSTVLSVTEGLEPGSLSALHALYSAILGGTHRTSSPILRILLTSYTTVANGLPAPTGDIDSADVLLPLVMVATVLGLQQHAVYGALRKLHSVLKVPALRESGRRGINFYHASFSDYLRSTGDYAVDVEMMSKLWWGFLTMLHGGDSICEVHFYFL